MRIRIPDLFDPGSGMNIPDQQHWSEVTKKRTLWWIVIFLIWERESATAAAAAAVGLVGVTLGAVFLELRPRGQLLLAQVAREPDLPAPIICRYYRQLLRIRIIFLGLVDLDPGPLVRGMDPDPSIIKQK
jgi:hypothetical protein